MRIITLFCIILMFFTFQGQAFEKTEHLSLDAKGISELEIDCGAGFLVVMGDNQVDRIEVEAEIVLDHVREKDIDNYLKHRVKLYLEKKGSGAILKSEINDNSFSFFGGNRDSYINLTVKVPSRLNLDVDDGSGSIEITGINGDVNIDDGSGSMDLEEIGGELTIDDGSGDIDLRKIEGDVEIDDGSGGIKIRGTSGDVNISDGSGEIDIIEVAGKVDIRDGSGELSVENVGGDVFVRDGSGSIYISNVDKDVIIDEAGSGSVSIHGVKGSVERHD